MRLILGGMLMTLAACNAPVEDTPPLAVVAETVVGSLPTALPIATDLPATPTTVPTAIPVPTATDEPADPAIPTASWQNFGPGLSHRVLSVGGGNGEQLYVLRIDPAQYRFDVAYRPTEPITLPEWQDETGALIVMNGGFFTAEYYATGLTIVNGVASGLSYDFGGMVAIRDGVLELKALSAEPYSPSESLDAGLQAFPMLVNRDGSAAFTEPAVNRARRTAIAQDKAGNVLFMIANRSNFTLTEFSAFLAQSDLDIAIAFNLDGGPSTGLLIRDPAIQFPSPVLLPTVLTVNKR